MPVGTAVTVNQTVNGTDTFTVGAGDSYVTTGYGLWVDGLGVGNYASVEIQSVPIARFVDAGAATATQSNLRIALEAGATMSATVFDSGAGACGATMGALQTIDV